MALQIWQGIRIAGEKQFGSPGDALDFLMAFDQKIRQALMACLMRSKDEEIS